ncbi:SDR family NAD(P)-dependent oxidoreductase, partial [Escherichia coli]|nr:SDR family NAD(P)-dependent oxidoreductase [Escherichia coli]
GLFDEIPVTEFRRVLDVNLLGTANGIRAALPHLSAAGGGVVVNNASGLAEVAMPYQSPYNAAKHGVRGLSDTVRQELRATGRGAVSICTVLP